MSQLLGGRVSPTSRDQSEKGTFSQTENRDPKSKHAKKTLVCPAAQTPTHPLCTPKFRRPGQLGKRGFSVDKASFGGRAYRFCLQFWNWLPYAEHEHTFSCTIYLEIAGMILQRHRRYADDSNQHGVLFA